MFSITNTLNIYRTRQKSNALQNIAAIMMMLLIVQSASAIDLQVQGSVSGVWRNEAGQIRVIGDIEVPVDDTLIITSGTRVMFDGYFTFEVSGLLIAQGVEDSPIVFTSEQLWGGIYFGNTANPASQIKGCEINNAWIGIETNRCNIGILNSSIDAVSIGINSIDASPTIRDNKLIRARSEDTREGGAVWAIGLSGHSTPQILNNKNITAISNLAGTATGIWINASSPTIEYNWIDVVSNQSAVGIYARRAQKIRIRRNIIRTYSPVMMRGLWSVYSTVSITSNDILLLSACDNAVAMMNDNGSTVTLINNILYGNGSSVGDSSVDGRVDSSSGYNDFFNHSVNHVGGWNGNNDISADPLFEFSGNDWNESYYRLTRNLSHSPPIVSPCIDAGSPLIDDPEDAFHTRSDIGRWCVSYQPVYAAPEISAPIANGFILHQAFPNPFNRTTQFTFELALPGPASVAVFDLNGRHIQDIWQGPAEAGIHNLVWSAQGLSAGEYLIRLNVSGQSQTSRVLYLP